MHGQSERTHRPLETELLDIEQTSAPSLVPAQIAQCTLDNPFVHRACDGNVLLSDLEEVARETVEDKNGGPPIRKDRFRGVICIHRNHSFFFNDSRDHVPALYLIEAGRHMLIAIAHYFYAVPLHAEFVLTEFHVWFKNMANLHDPLSVENTISRHIYRKGKLIGMYSCGSIRQNGVEIAHLTGSMALMNENLRKRLERACHSA